MRAIEEAFSVIAPDSCGFGAFVDEKFRPICPTAHLLAYNGEDLKKIFKRKSENRVKKLAFLIGVLPDALAEFIFAWDILMEEGNDKKFAFDRALTAAEKVEIAEEERQERFRKLREQINAPPPVNILSKVKFPPGVNHYTQGVILELDPKEGWVFKDVFKDEPVTGIS